MILAHGFYVIDEFLGVPLCLAVVAFLAFFLLHGPARQSLVLSAFALIVGAPLLYVAFLVSFRMRAPYDRSFMTFLGGVACAPFVLGCIGVGLWFYRTKR